MTAIWRVKARLSRLTSGLAGREMMTTAGLTMSADRAAAALLHKPRGIPCTTPRYKSACKSKPTPPTYRTTNWRDDNAALKQRGSLQIWFDPETVWLAEPGGKRGRPARFTDAAIQPRRLRRYPLA